MARDLSKYLNELAPADDGDLEASDERLLAIIEFFDKRKFGAAADKAEELAQAGVFDIRPLSYVSFVAFYEGGIAALESVFDVVAAVLGPQLRFIGPQKNQSLFFAKRLTWLWTTISDHLAYYRKEGGADWDRMRAGVTVESIATILERAQVVDSALTDAAQEKTGFALGTLMGALRTLADELDVANRSANDSAAQGSPEMKMDENGVEIDEDGVNPPEHVANVNKANSGKRAVTLDVSPHFLDLLAKLRGFEVLLEQGNLMKAAVVAEDVQNIIENFDPRVYFPNTFSRFSELLSQNAETLGEYIENRDSFGWKAMAQFYRVDLEKFIKGEGDGSGRRR